MAALLLGYSIPYLIGSYQNIIGTVLLFVTACEFVVYIGFISYITVKNVKTVISLIG